MALNIAVLPACRGELAGQMISELQAVTLEAGEACCEKNCSKLVLELLDQELDYLLIAQSGGPSKSRRHAIDVITQTLKEI